MSPTDEQLDPFGEIVRCREEMERLWDLRQENILPLENAWNVGRFYGIILRGGRAFTRLQRAGILALGLTAAGMAASVAFLIPPLDLLHEGSHISHLPIFLRPSILISASGGLRLLWVALKPYHPRR